MSNENVRLILTKEQAALVKNAVHNYIQDIEKNLNEGIYEPNGSIYELIRGRMEQVKMVYALLEARMKPCPACTKTGSIHQNCILR